MLIWPFKKYLKAIHARISFGTTISSQKTVNEFIIFKNSTQQKILHTCKARMIDIIFSNKK